MSRCHLRTAHAPLQRRDALSMRACHVPFFILGPGFRQERLTPCFMLFEVLPPAKPQQALRSPRPCIFRPSFCHTFSLTPLAGFLFHSLQASFLTLCKLQFSLPAGLLTHSPQASFLTSCRLLCFSSQAPFAPNWVSSSSWQASPQWGGGEISGGQICVLHLLRASFIQLSLLRVGPTCMSAFLLLSYPV